MTIMLIGALLIVAFTHCLLIGVTWIGKDKVYTSKILYFVANLIVNILSAANMLRDKMEQIPISGTTVMLFIITAMSLQSEMIPVLQGKYIEIRKRGNGKMFKKAGFVIICILAIVSIPIFLGWFSQYLSNVMDVNNSKC